MASHKLFVFVYGYRIIIFGQCNYRVANDTRDDTLVRSDAIESSSNIDVYGYLFEYWYALYFHITSRFFHLFCVIFHIFISLLKIRF